MQTYATRSGLKRAMSAIVPGAYEQAVEERRICQTSDGRWYEAPPRPRALPNLAFLNVRKGDASLVREVAKQEFGAAYGRTVSHSVAV